VDLRALKSRYPQMAGIDHVLISDSQVSYKYGTVRCGSKARPCWFSSPSACRVTVNLTQIESRAETKLHPRPSKVYALPDGTYLEVESDILATPTRKGRLSSEKVGQVVDVRVKSLRTRLAASPRESNN
jgi:hypothetical protein